MMNRPVSRGAKQRADSQPADVTQSIHNRGSANVQGSGRQYNFNVTGGAVVVALCAFGAIAIIVGAVIAVPRLSHSAASPRVSAPAPTESVALTSLSLRSARSSLLSGSSLRLQLNGLLVGGHSASAADLANVRWRSSLPSALAVSDDGTITAHGRSREQVTVTAEAGGLTARIVITVTPRPVSHPKPTVGSSGHPASTYVPSYPSSVQSTAATKAPATHAAATPTPTPSPSPSLSQSQLPL
jgi:hypothetical protein